MTIRGFAKSCGKEPTIHYRILFSLAKVFACFAFWAPGSSHPTCREERRTVGSVWRYFGKRDRHCRGRVGCAMTGLGLLTPGGLEVSQVWDVIQPGPSCKTHAVSTTSNAWPGVTLTSLESVTTRRRGSTFKAASKALAPNRAEAFVKGPLLSPFRATL